jgi:aspartyl-tRNA(Asn)/glutamyl-tRNA(Gln) amidotransferase subunit C
MSISLEEVEHIAELARLNLSRKEKERFKEQLSAILDFAAKLRDVDTSTIPPTSSVLPARSVLRKDQPRPGLKPEEVFRNAPQQEDRQFKVPPVLDADTI